MQLILAMNRALGLKFIYFVQKEDGWEKDPFLS